MSAIPNADWTELYTEYRPKIYNYFRKRIKDSDLVDDFTSETFYKAFDASERNHGANSHFSGWLFRIARNLMFDHFREKKQRELVSIDSVAELYDPSDLHAHTEDKLKLDKVRMVLSQLTDEQQTVLSLRIEHGFEFREIARMMGKSEAAVKALLHRARESIGVLLDLDGRPRRSPGCQDEVAKTLRKGGPMTVTEIVRVTDLTRNAVYTALYNYPDRFCKVDAIERGRVVVYKWSLVK